MDLRGGPPRPQLGPDDRAHPAGTDRAALEEGLAHAVVAGPLTIRPYKLGPEDPEDIRLVRLDPSSATKALIAQSNDRVVRGQLVLDLAKGLPAPTEEEQAAAYAANELVMGHFGNHHRGRQPSTSGAPPPGSRMLAWRVVKLAVRSGPGREIAVPEGPSARPSVSQRAEPRCVSPREISAAHDVVVTSRSVLHRPLALELAREASSQGRAGQGGRITPAAVSQSSTREPSASPHSSARAGPRRTARLEQRRAGPRGTGSTPCFRSSVDPQIQRTRAPPEQARPRGGPSWSTA